MKRVLGDFQTPLPLAHQVIESLKLEGVTWDRILEPTCGIGNFIHVLAFDKNEICQIIGIEIQDEYTDAARKKFLKAPNVTIINNSVFDCDLNLELPWKSDGKLLVVGNPPWVTNSTMGSLGGNNLPSKSNFKQLRGIEAITGHANFDIAEFIWLKLIADLSQTPATIALLCKTSVARNVIQYAHDEKLAISDMTVRLIDSRIWFDAAVDACLFTVSLNNGSSNYQARVFGTLNAKEPTHTIGYIGDAFVANVESYIKYSHLEQFSETDAKFIWRAGIKHDASSVMELRWINGEWVNGYNVIVDVEDDYIFPLLKSSDVHKFTGRSTGKAMVVTQRNVGEDTSLLQKSAPKLWKYLNYYNSIFKERKSSIYRSKPAFSIFGVGDYTFAPYKVVISGFYKEPIFIPVGKIDGKEIVCDDTCYILPFFSAADAILAACALNHPVTRRFLDSITFSDSKRPFTKSLLSRININEIISSLPREDLETEAKIYWARFPTEIPLERLPSKLIGNLSIKRKKYKSSKIDIQPKLF